MTLKSLRSIRCRWFGRSKAHRGAAVVEMAVVSPLLLMLLLGIVEFGYIFMVEQSLTNATREACRLATLPGTTDEQIRSRLQDTVAGTGLEIDTSMVVIQRSTGTTPTVSVRVQMPYEDVTLLGVLPSSLFCGFNGGTGEGDSTPDAIGSKTIGSSCSMRVEGDT